MATMIMGVKTPDHLHDPVEVEEGREDHEHRAQGATRPRGQAELLLEVRTGAREHHEAHREAREDEHDAMTRRSAGWVMRSKTSS